MEFEKFLFHLNDFLKLRFYTLEYRLTPQTTYFMDIFFFFFFFLTKNSNYNEFYSSWHAHIYALKSGMCACMTAKIISFVDLPSVGFLVLR